VTQVTAIVVGSQPAGHHPADREAYAALKQRLAADYTDNRVTYTDQKTEFVRAIEERALSTKADPPRA
jgi:GrpB-like predicted nucleotidyltransferase (UPF0157 family)